MDDLTCLRPCPACSGRGYLTSTLRRYRPLCHVCRGAGVESVSSATNRLTYMARHSRDLRTVVSLVDDIFACARRVSL